MLHAPNHERLLADLGRQHGYSRGRDRVHLVQRRVEDLAELPAAALRIQVVDRGDEQALVEQRALVLAIVLRPRPVAPGVDGRRFRQQDHARDGVELLHVRHGDLDHFRA